ncbi:hypothetical protein ACFQJC_01460 [Haloferax namakaokahaiae]|uniref:Holin n=1 Tax=Haloferax namakaokahaiae TaxID=1748331 RepID=A0ABD5ZB24_9EURY
MDFSEWQWSRIFAFVAGFGVLALLSLGELSQTLSDPVQTVLLASAAGLVFNGFPAIPWRRAAAFVNRSESERNRRD